MADDHELEPAKPSSSNLEVGDFDRLSGFFTPVWESKKRIRSETPIPPSPGSKSDQTKVSKAAAPVEAKAAPVEQKPPERAAEKPPRQGEIAAKVPRRDRTATSPGRAGARKPTQRSKAKRSEADGSRDAIDEANAIQKAARETIAAPLARPRRPSGSDDRALSSRGGLATQSSEPELPPKAFVDDEPELRDETAAALRATRERALRASAVATRLHRELEQKRDPGELAGAPAPGAHDTVRDLVAPGPAKSPDDPLSSSVLRRFRRSWHLSTSLPEPIRSRVLRARSN